MLFASGHWVVSGRRVNEKQSPKIMKIPVAAVAAFSIVALTLVATPAAAQRETMRSLSARVQSIERDLDAIKRYLAHEDVETGNFRAPVAAGGGARAAEIEVHLNSLEAELQTLTGLVEESGYRMRLLGERLEKLVEDVEFRLAAVERGAVGTASASAKVSAVEDAGFAAAATPAAEEQVGDAFADLSATELYESARARLRAEEYDDAEIAFGRFLEKFSQHELAGNAQYWLGHSFYQRRDFENAATAFLDGYEKYGDGAKAPDSLLKAGMSLNALGLSQEACTLYREFDTKYPDAEKRLSDLLNSEARRAGCS